MTFAPHVTPVLMLQKYVVEVELIPLLALK